MDIIGSTPLALGMPRATTPKAQELIDTRDVQGEYYFLDLRPRGTGALRVAFGGRERCGENYLVQRQTFPFITLEYVEAGQGRISYGDAEALPLLPGTLFTHGPGQKVMIQGLAGRKMVKHFVCLIGYRAADVVRQYAPVFGLKPNLGLQADVGEAFDLLGREGRRHTPFAKTICNHLIYYALQKIGEATVQPGRNDSAARGKYLRCKALIDENPPGISTLRDVCTRMGIEASGLCRIFKRYQGISPYQYILRRRMSLAAQELIHTGGLIKEVAERLGYADPYHFSRVFKSVHGISPARFIRNYDTKP